MAPPPWVKSCKNDRVFSSLRKRKNFEFFSTCSDGGDIEATDVDGREAGMARPPWVKSRKNDRVFSSLRKRKNFEIFSTCSDGGNISGGNGPCRDAGMLSPPSDKSRTNYPSPSTLGWHSPHCPCIPIPLRSPARTNQSPVQPPSPSALSRARTTIFAYLSHSEAPLVLARAQFSLRTTLQ